MLSPNVLCVHPYNCSRPTQLFATVIGLLLLLAVQKILSKMINPEEDSLKKLHGPVHRLLKNAMMCSVFFIYKGNAATSPTVRS